MVDMLPTEVNDEVEQKDTVSVMHEDERRDTVVDVSAPESPPPTIEELSEETVNERTEEPRDEETSGATETDNSTSSALEQAANPIESPQTNGPDLIVPDFSPETALDSYPSKITLAPSATPVLEVDPYPYSLSTPGEHPDPMEQEISGVSSPSTGDKDSEKTDDATSVVTSPDNDPVDFDEMELRYLAEPDVKPAADDEAEGMESVGAVDDEESAESVGAVDDELEGTESVGAAADEVEGPESAGVDEVIGTESVGSVDDEVEGAESVGAADDVSEGSETDADGDDDPDYTTSASSVAGNADVEVPSGPEAQESGYMEEEPTEDYTANTEPSRDPDGITNRMVDIAESVDVEAPAEHAEAEDVLGKVNEPLVQEDALVDEISSQLGEIPGPRRIPPTTVEDDDDVDPVLDTGSPPPSLKRKREHATKEAASTGKNLGKIAESRLSRRHTLQRNGKGKAKAEDLEDDASSTSSASSAARMLNPGSRGSSRASSIASARSVNVSLALSDSSPSLLPRVNSIIKAARPPPKHPPASAKPPPPPPAPPPPPPLLHAHSHNRAVPHHRHPPSLSRQPTQQQRLLQRAPSGNGVNEEPPSPSTSSVQMPAPSRRAPPAAGSPVTRSNCRYHRISLPEDDSDQEGPRVRFLVPGCSLGDKDLMDEENIKDEGYATTEDSERMIKDLDALHFDSYLIGTLRQLVGVDLLREQEIYYLPRPDEELRLRHPRRREQSKLRISSGGSFASDGGAMSPGVRSPGSISSRAPNSAAGSSSTTSVQARRRKRSDRGSPTPPAWTQSQGDESTDDESPDAKRIRAAEAEGIAAAASGSPLRTRRSKRRIDKEAAEYKPEKPEAVDESSEEEGDKGRRKKKKANGRGLKRGRQSEATSAQEGGEDRKTKKLKTHESIGGSGV
ncbi:hypothetical protein B0H11DRAFT_1987125 [Mycena galericulata]|nr:hypothetical protein B0H11DRAFT_1987125 [Mycena galericulata]